MTVLPSGFYTMKRGWQDHPAFLVPLDQFDRRSAWIWLIEKAAFRETKFYARFGRITIERGQLCTSYNQLATAWNWNRCRVQAFLNRLRADTMVDTKTDSGQMVITICNYEQYQYNSNAENSTTDTSDDHDPIHTRYTPDTHKEIREIEERKKEKGRPYVPQPTQLGVPPRGVLEEGEDQSDLLSDRPSATVLRMPPDDCNAAMELWNDMARKANLAVVKHLSDVRRRRLRARLKEAGGLEGWSHALAEVQGSSYLCGRVKNWRIDFDFLISAAKFPKIMEGGWRDQTPRAFEGDPTRQALFEINQELRETGTIA